MNLDARGRQIRLAIGLISTALLVTAIFVLPAVRAPREWRAILFFPALGASLGFLQARAAT